ncbi:hypothetical protein BST61_g8485 [Cercospora zeina]
MATGLPAGWEVRHSNSKNLPYYFNAATKESRWEPPTETDSETLKHYMGQYHTANLRADHAQQQSLDGKIRAAHLLVKHKDSRRPSSWRESEITRSKDEAREIIRGHESKIRNGETSLGDLAVTESDCSSARKRGDLGFFGKGDMQAEFEQASFALKPGEISQIIETQSGLHLIERLDFRGADAFGPAYSAFTPESEQARQTRRHTRPAATGGDRHDNHLRSTFLGLRCTLPQQLQLDDKQLLATPHAPCRITARPHTLCTQSTFLDPPPRHSAKHLRPSINPLTHFHLRPLHSPVLPQTNLEAPSTSAQEIKSIHQDNNTMDFIQQRPRAGSAQSRQPIHRRPSWAKSPKSYEIYMRPSPDRSSQPDHGLENYSYDEAHLAGWTPPKELEARFPPELMSAVNEWKHAGAAVCTALVRIEKLDDESLYRGYPEHTMAHLSRRPSVQSSAIVGAETPPMSSPVSPAPTALPASLLRLEKLEQLPYRQVVGMESPPFTPADTPSCPTPEVQSAFSLPDARSYPIVLPYPESIASTGASKSDGYSSFFGSYATTAPSTPAMVSFDEPAWETFLKAYSAELYDINTYAGPRLKGAGYSIDRVRVELGMTKENEEVLADFNKWWTEMKAKVAHYDEKIRELEMPSIDTVRAERLANGMPI